MNKLNNVNKKCVAIFLMVLGILIIAFISNIEKNKGKTIVTEMYVKECPCCGYDKMEGEYSYITNSGYEYCPNCQKHTEITNK